MFLTLYVEFYVNVCNYLVIQFSHISAFDEWLGDNEDAKIFISYQWDMQSRVETIRSILEKHGYTCWAENATMSQRGHSSMSSRSNHSVTSTESLQSQIQRNMRSATIVLSCITPKYVQSDNCLKDLTLAEIHHKPILALLMRFIPGWPPEGAPPQVRKILTRHSCIDLSNEKMYKQNIRTLIDRVQKLISHWWAAKCRVHNEILYKLCLVIFLYLYIISYHSD